MTAVWKTALHKRFLPRDQIPGRFTHYALRNNEIRTERHIVKPNSTLPALQSALDFPLVQALLGRRSRRFGLGMALVDGPLAYTSQHDPLPLNETEQMLVLLAAAGNSGWNYLIPRQNAALSAIANYPAAAGGRTFPSAAGWHTTELFYTDDDGAYFFPTRDVPALAEPNVDGEFNMDELLAAHRARVRQLSKHRLQIAPAHMDAHNTWCANAPGSTLLIPVADMAQHLIGVICFMVQNGGSIYDNVHNERIPGLARFAHLVDVENPAPLTEIEMNCLTMCMAELSIACHNGMLMLQALGLGGWLYTGLDAFAVLGAGGAASPGLGFRYDTNVAWNTPNPTGLPGVLEGFCPPHFADMRAAVEAFVARKFGPGGPLNAETAGPWRDNARVRGSAIAHNAEFIECVALMAQYVYDRFGRFPATVPTMFTRIYLQAQHLDTDFYDVHFAPGAYLRTHGAHMQNWHGDA